MDAAWTALSCPVATAATAINVVRLDAWYSGKPLDRTRTTHLQRIDLVPAG